MITPAGPCPWVDAAPFRAHVRHLCDASGLPWEVVAVQARVSVSLVDHLLHGHRGRMPARLAPQSAARLLRVTPADLVTLRASVVDATECAAEARSLLEDGVPAAWLAAFCRMTVRQLLCFAESRRGSCTALTARLVAAASARWAAEAWRRVA